MLRYFPPFEFCCYYSWGFILYFLLVFWCVCGGGVMCLCVYVCACVLTMVPFSILWQQSWDNENKTCEKKHLKVQQPQIWVVSWWHIRVWVSAEEACLKYSVHFCVWNVGGFLFSFNSRVSIQAYGYTKQIVTNYYY